MLFFCSRSLSKQRRGILSFPLFLVFFNFLFSYHSLYFFPSSFSFSGRETSDSGAFDTGQTGDYQIKLYQICHGRMDGRQQDVA